MKNKLINKHKKEGDFYIHANITSFVIALFSMFLEPNSNFKILVFMTIPVIYAFSLSMVLKEIG